MKHIFSIYKFKTPFFILDKEKTNLEKLYEKTKEFFEFQGIVYTITIKQDNFFKSYYFSSSNVLLVISLGKNINTSYLPFMNFHLYLSEDFIKNHDIHSFCSLYFEIFDGLGETSFLLDINKSYLSVNTLEHDFLTLDFLSKKYKSEKEICLFLEKYISKKVHIGQGDFLKMEAIFLYFLYLTYQMFNNITKIEKEKLKNQRIIQTHHQNKSLIQNLQLFQNRLSQVEDINIVSFKKYLTMLESFYKLFV